MDLKPGDLVRCKWAQWNSHNEKLSLTRIYTIDIIDQTISLKEEPESGGVFSKHAFVKIDPASISKLERILWGLAE